MNRSPCMRDCPDRTATCHGGCEKYKAWKKEHDEAMEWLKEKNTVITSERAKRAYHEKIMRTARGLEKKRRKYDKY